MDADSNQVVPICNTNYPTTIKTHPPLERTVSLARDGSVDFRGNTADKRASGRLKANAFIIGIEISYKHQFCESCTLERSDLTAQNGSGNICTPCRSRRDQFQI